MSIHPESGTNSAGDPESITLGKIGADKMTLEVTREHVQKLSNNNRVLQGRVDVATEIADAAVQGVDYLGKRFTEVVEINEQLQREIDVATARAKFAEGVIYQFNPEQVAKRYNASLRISSRKEARENRFSVRVGRVIDGWTQKAFTGVGTFIIRVRTELIRALESVESNQHLQ